MKLSYAANDSVIWIIEILMEYNIEYQTSIYRFLIYMSLVDWEYVMEGLFNNVGLVGVRLHVPNDHVLMFGAYGLNYHR